MLATFKHSDDFIIFPADKNLGPCILERREYIRRGFSDHLSDQTTYQSLSAAEACTACLNTSNLIYKWTKTFEAAIVKNDLKYIQLKLEKSQVTP
jgi:hypothetical protein